MLKSAKTLEQIKNKLRLKKVFNPFSSHENTLYAMSSCRFEKTLMFNTIKFGQFSFLSASLSKNSLVLIKKVKSHF